MSDMENELKEMMLELDKRNQEVMDDILNKQKERIQHLETEGPKGKMVMTHGFSKEDVRLLWIDEDFKYQHMKKKIDSLARLQHSMKQFDSKKLPNPSFFNLDELYKNHTRIGELQARERERIMIRLGFWPANPPADSSSTIHPEAGKRGSATVLNQHPASSSSGDVNGDEHFGPQHDDDASGGDGDVNGDEHDDDALPSAGGASGGNLCQKRPIRMNKSIGVNIVGSRDLVSPSRQFSLSGRKPKRIAKRQRRKTKE